MGCLQGRVTTQRTVHGSQKIAKKQGKETRLFSSCVLYAEYSPGADVAPRHLILARQSWTDLLITNP